MIDIKDPKDCCGCTACASICVHDAISMEPDNLGFLYPKVDASKCVDCGLCDRICQFNEDYDRSQNLPQPLAFAARHKAIDELMKSRSGAAFAAISDYILEQGGIVYGAGYKDHFCVAHKRATTKEERDDFRGSKYVQSDMTGIFMRVKDDLRKGLMVLFSGTPCQTAGLNAFVGKKLRERLYLVDIVCHGVPSPFVWQDYLTWIERKFGSKVNYVNFRDKELWGWSDHKETYKFEHKKEKLTMIVFTYTFYQHIIFRHSCGVCHYTNLQRPSDITLADYWGWERTSPDFNIDDNGCSLLLCNTEKGCELLDRVKEKMNIIHAELSNVSQDHLSKPSVIHPDRDKFEHVYVKKGFEYTMKAFALMGYKYHLKQFWLRVKRKITSK